LCELTKKPADFILNVLERGIKEQFIVRDLTARKYLFMHDRLREAFYRKVPEEERVPLHRQLAEMLEKQNQGIWIRLFMIWPITYVWKSGRESAELLAKKLPLNGKLLMPISRLLISM